MDATTKYSPRIIDLAELRAADDFPCWAAIFCPRRASPFVLSPGAMRWRDDVYLVRLGECKSFWLEQKKKLRCKLTDLFAPLLQHHYGDDHITVFGNHPWQCLWYLEYQRRHCGPGLYLLQSPLNSNIYRGLDWESWFSLQHELADHLDEVNACGFRRHEFARRQAQMQRFIERIGIATPHAMQQADANSIRRRFGDWLGQIWQWSFSADNQLQRFPWRPFARQQAPAIERDLEYPVNQWTYIKVLLREDLSCLCDQVREDDCEHINRMDWQVTLFNDQQISIELSFRHPYSLHRDKPGFETALYQASYVFDDLMRRQRARASDLDLPASMPFYRWRIEIRERVTLAPQLWELFARESAELDYERVRALQNKLPLAFECYRPAASFCPEQSFAGIAPGESPVQDFDPQAWACGAFNKPLFYCPSAQPIENPTRMQRIFLERNSGQWWLGGDSLQAMRDYYLLRDRNGRAIWAYRTLDGAWFKQGEYH